MKIYKNIVLVIFLSAAALSGKAQDLNDKEMRQYADSLQRVVMRKQLGVGDEAITTVLTLKKLLFKERGADSDECSTQCFKKGRVDTRPCKTNQRSYQKRTRSKCI